MRLDQIQRWSRTPSYRTLHGVLYKLRTLRQCRKMMPVIPLYTSASTKRMYKTLNSSLAIFPRKSFSCLQSDPFAAAGNQNCPTRKYKFSLASHLASLCPFTWKKKKFVKMCQFVPQFAWMASSFSLTFRHVRECLRDMRTAAKDSLHALQKVYRVTQEANNKYQ